MQLTNCQHDNTLLYNIKLFNNELFNTIVYINSVRLVTVAIDLAFGVVGDLIFVGIRRPGSISGGSISGGGNHAFLHDLAI